MKKFKLTRKRLESFLLAFLITALTASVANLFSRPDSAWYLSLNKPVFQPPDIVFPIVWGIIYILAAVSLALVIYTPAAKSGEEQTAPEETESKLKSKTKGKIKQKNPKQKVYILFALQALLHILWNIVFFVLQMPVIGFVLIVAYMVIVYLTIREAYSIHKWAAYLQIPHLLWLIFAAALNYMIVLLN